MENHYNMTSVQQPQQINSSSLPLTLLKEKKITDTSYIEGLSKEDQILKILLKEKMQNNFARQTFLKGAYLRDNLHIPECDSKIDDVNFSDSLKTCVYPMYRFDPCNPGTPNVFYGSIMYHPKNENRLKYYNLCSLLWEKLIARHNFQSKYIYIPRSSGKYQVVYINSSHPLRWSNSEKGPSLLCFYNNNIDNPCSYSELDFGNMYKRIHLRDSDDAKGLLNCNTDTFALQNFLEDIDCLKFIKILEKINITRLRQLKEYNKENLKSQLIEFTLATSLEQIEEFVEKVYSNINKPLRDEKWFENALEYKKKPEAGEKYPCGIFDTNDDICIEMGIPTIEDNLFKYEEKELRQKVQELFEKFNIKYSFYNYKLE